MGRRSVSCKLCGEDTKLVNAHVIPRSFFEIDAGALPKVLSNKQEAHSKRTPVGIYDSELLCVPCERRFSSWDGYGNQILLRDRGEFTPLDGSSDPIGYERSSLDCRRLNEFLLSVLWRASASGHYFYSKVNLGPHESRVREILFGDERGAPNPYETILAKFPRSYGMLDPHMTRLKDINFVQMYLAEYVAYMKVDQRPTPGFLRDFVLAGSGPVVLLGRSPSRGKDAELLRKIAMQNDRAFPRPSRS